MPLHSSLLQPTGARFRIALAQMNSVMGDLPGNTERIVQRINEAREKGASLVAFPELALTGYPPEDLLLKPGFLRDNLEALQTVARAATDIVAVVGFVDVREDIYNAAAVLTDGKVAGVYHKTFLPNYGVFDEDRYFMRGSSPLVFRLKDLTFGVTVCEDIWYTQGPAHAMATLGGAHLIVNINASPFSRGKWEFREKMLATRAGDDGFHLAYVNMIGGQDELVFDGGSLVFNPRGELLARAAHFEEELLLCDLDLMEVMHARLADPRLRKGRVALNNAGVEMPVTTLPPLPDRETSEPVPARIAETPSRCSEVYQALVLGVRDYVNKNGFAGVVIGISGGIDSALVACIAADALGPERVTLVSMPSTYSSGATQSDAELIARNLGTHFHEIPIKDLQATWSQTLAAVFSGTESGVAEENLQARSRGNILMAISNKFGAMVLTTGNKSEMACGYATLYGDMAGGFAVIKDVPKTLVFELSEWRNALTPDNPPIPPTTITRPPSAELRPNQKDTDSLPPYEILDPIIEAYVEEDRSLEELVALGFDEAICRRVILMIDRNEYKRRQAAPGIKITPKAFGRDRRLPITNRFHDL